MVDSTHHFDDTETGEAVYRLGNFTVTPNAGTIVLGDEIIRLEPIVMRLLSRLAKAPNETVSRDALVQDVWDAAFVTDDTIYQAVGRLRRALKRDPAASVSVSTVPKIGYRLDARARTAKAPGALRSVKRRFALAGGAGLVVLASFGVVRVAGAPNAPAPKSTERDVVVVANSFGYEGQPSVAPDGESIAYIKRGTDYGGADIFVRMVGDDEEFNLTKTPDAFEAVPAWSPDGRTIAFQHQTDDGCTISTVGALGGAVRKIASCRWADAWDIAWSPDGKRMAYLTKDADYAPIRTAVIDIATGETIAKSPAPANAWESGDHDIAFAPDGDHIALIRGRAPYANDIYVWNWRTDDFIRTTHEGLAVYSLAWSREDGLLAAANWDGFGEIWRVDPWSGARRQLSLPGLYKVHVGARSGVMAYAAIAQSTTLEVHDLETGEVFKAPAGKGFDWSLDAAHDGDRVAYISERSGMAEIWTSDMFGAQRRRLTKLEGPPISNLSVNPHDGRIAMTAGLFGDIDVFIIDPAEARPRRLTRHPANERHASWSHDGRSILFSSNIDGPWTVWRVDAEGGEPVREDRADGAAFALEGPRGALLVHTYEGALELRHPDGSTKAILKGERPLSREAARFAGDGLFVMVQGDDDGDGTKGRAELFRIDLNTGRETHLKSFTSVVRQSGLAVFEGGRRVAILTDHISDADVYAASIAKDDIRLARD